MSKQTITISGTVYDKATGLPMRTIDSAPRINRGYASNVHAQTQRSQTLSRRHVKSRLVVPSATPQSAPAAVPRPMPQRSPMISKYAPHPVSQPRQQTTESITPASSHPIVVKAAAKQPRLKQQPSPVVTPMQAPASPVKRTHKPSDIIKAEATAKALKEAPLHNRSTHRNRSKSKPTRKRLFGRALSFASSGVALLLIAGYFTYINMPSLSVRVAAVQSGVDASYPSYRPSGYSLSGPVAYESGEVRMAFAANGTNHGFTLSQSKSGWDSSAVRENYVTPKAGEDYLTTASGGLTIYSWGGNAAWVSNGVLYTIDGDAPLTPDQVSRIATSL